MSGDADRPSSAGVGGSQASAGKAPVSALLLMGVSGCGKTTVGEALARELGWRFVDADDHHPPANVEKMRSGRPLDDADRAPWLARLNALLRHSAARGEPVVLACSALKARYRAQLADRLPGLRVVFLSGSQALIEARLADRRHRYMPASLLASQFAALEPPEEAWVVDIGEPPAALAAGLAARVRAGAG